MNGETPHSPTPDSEQSTWTKPEDGIASSVIKTSTTTATKSDDNKFTVQVITKYMCRYCARQFDSPAEMQAHISTHARGKSSTHSCYVCGKTYSTPSKLQRHVRVHSGERPYACNICGRRFTRSDHVKQHLKVHMPQKQRNACRICGMKFLRRQTLHCHLQQDHAIIQVFTCHRCGEAFDCIEKLHTHKDAHLSIYPQNSVQEVEGGIVIKKEPGVAPDDNKGENPIVGLAKFSLGPQPSLVEEAQHTISQQRKSAAKSLRFENRGNGIKMESNGVTSLSTDEEKAMEEMIKNALAEARQLEAETKNSNEYDGHKSGTTVTDGTQMFILPSQIKKERIDENDPENKSREVTAGENNVMHNEDHNKGCQTMCDDDDDDEDDADESQEEEEDDTKKIENIKVEKMDVDNAEELNDKSKSNEKSDVGEEPKMEKTASISDVSADMPSQAPVPKMKIKLLGPASYKAAMQNKLQLQALNPPAGGSKVIGTLTPVAPVLSPNNPSNLNRLISSAKPVWGPGMACSTSTVKATPTVTNSTASTVTPQTQTKRLTRCEHCCIWFEDYTMSLLHNSLHSADETDPFTCRKCLKKLGNRLEFTAHLVWHLEPNMDC